MDNVKKFLKSMERMRVASADLRAMFEKLDEDTKEKLWIGYPFGGSYDEMDEFLIEWMDKSQRTLKGVKK